MVSIKREVPLSSVLAGNGKRFNYLERYTLRYMYAKIYGKAECPIPEVKGWA
jgi:hypothetical protein